MKAILDACCGGRMFWHQKDTPGVVFMDCRSFDPVYLEAPRQWFGVQPGVVGDFRAMPFEDATFRLVVFDPPHVIRNVDGHITLKYGRLDRDTWREDIAAGFRECLRVLDPAGFLIFKWAEDSVRLAEVLALAPHPPLFGNRSGKTSHWLVFAQSPTAIGQAPCPDCFAVHAPCSDATSCDCCRAMAGAS